MKRFMTAVFGALLAMALPAAGETFRDGETVCFLGDSITHGGRFHSHVYDYYLTRFPERAIRFVNAGVSGDSARGAMGRLAEDVIDKRPSAVVVMLGMNDVGRGNYVADPDAGKKADPAFTIIGPDRVHPGPPGHLMMAWLFLKAQGAPALVSRVAIDATAGRVTVSENARVGGPVRSGDGWSFTVLAGALPFPIEDAARPLLALAPVERDLNQEILKVEDLGRQALAARKPEPHTYVIRPIP